MMHAKLLLGKSIFLTRMIARSNSIVKVKQLQLTKYGDHSEGAVTLVEKDLPVALKNGQVLLKLIASAINPADINVIQGKYGHLPTASVLTIRIALLPEVIGNEAVFEVSEKSSDAVSLNEGDHVLLDCVGTGTWSSFLIADAKNLIKVPKSLPIEIKSTLLVNPPTAYLLLREFVDLEVGENVILNAPTSQVGRSVIQIAKQRNLKTICVVRSGTDDRNQIEDLSPEVICTEEELREREMWKNMQKPRLALNCVGGKTATDMLRVLAPGGTMVTYGGLSLQPLTIPTGSLIFRDQKFVGFWISMWRTKNGVENFAKIIDEIAKMALEGKFASPTCKQFKLDDYHNALACANSHNKKVKCLFVP